MVVLALSLDSCRRTNKRNPEYNQYNQFHWHHYAPCSLAGILPSPTWTPVTKQLGVRYSAVTRWQSQWRHGGISVWFALHLEIISQCCVAQNDSLKSDETRKDDLVRTLDFLHGHFVTNVGFSPFFLFKVLRKLKSLPLKLHIFNSFFFHGPNCCFVLSFWGFTVTLNLNVIKVGFLKYFVSIKAILSLAASSSSL